MHDDISIPVQRLLALRQHPGFVDADLGELAALAENLRETAFPAGAVVARPGARVTGLHLVIHGQLASSTTHVSKAWGPHDVFGVLEVIAGHSVPASVIAVVPTRTLQLSAADLSEVLEDNFGLLTNALRGVARNVLAKRERRGSAPWRRPANTISPGRELGLVERMMLLRPHFPFAPLQPLAALAHASIERSWQGGELISRRDEPADGASVIIEGAVRSVRRGTEHRSVPNDAVGMLETLADQRHATTTEALRATRGLFVPAAALFDVMEDHTDFGLGMVTMLAGELLDQIAVEDAHTN